MKRYIELDKAIETLCDNCPRDFLCQEKCDDVIRLSEISTADMYEVVHCKDCVHFCPYEVVEEEDFDGRCTARGGGADKDDFCNYGQKRGLKKMPKYINADAEIEKMKNVIIERKRNGADDGFTDCIFDMFINAINKAPAADVQEVKHGYWIDTYVIVEKEVQHHYENFKENRVICSHCSSLFAVKTDYCPHCGTRMDGDEKGDINR